ncbi:MAG: protein-disulfide reductase DsbD family protein [Chitinophagaceae bacterium]
MKKVLFMVVLSFLAVGAFAQSVSWKTSAVKKSAGLYEVSIVATVPSTWHIYSQNMTGDGPVPTKFTFTKNPLLTLSGKTQEKGNLQSVHDKNFDMEVKYYAGTVTFTQLVKVKGNAHTNLSGSVEYMICNDHECLPPSKEAFSVKL